MAPQRRKNSAVDRKWIADHAREMVRVVGDQVVWSGHQIDVGNPLVLPPDDQRCSWTHTVRDDAGTPVLNVELDDLRIRCNRWGLRLAYGRVFHLCSVHAKGGTRAIRQEMLEQASVALLGRALDHALDPNTELKEAWPIIKDMLDRVGMRAGVQVEHKFTGFEGTMERLMALTADINADTGEEDNDDDE